jgi:hypothetical protein
VAPANLIGRRSGRQTEVGIRTIRQLQDLASYAFQSESCPQHGPQSTEIIGWQRELDPAQPTTHQQVLRRRAERPFEPLGGDRNVNHKKT